MAGNDLMAGGLVHRIAARIASLTEARLGGSPALGMTLGFGPMAGSGTFVNPRLAENLATVMACVSAIASGIATLPALVYRHTDAGRVELPDHPVARLIRRPNERQTWPDFVEMLLGSVLLYGNALAIIQSDGAGRATGLLPVPWPFVMPLLLPSGALAYDVARIVMPWGGTGSPRRYLADEVIHLKDRSDDGYLGRSRLSRASQTVSTALDLQQFSGAIWTNGATPSGLLKTAGKLSTDARAMLVDQWRDNYQGTQNARKTVVLEQGLEYQQMAVSPEDAEVLESRRFTGEELARLFGVPPPIIGDLSHGSFLNMETAGRWFAQFTLGPWARKLEQEFCRVLFNNADDHLEIDLSGLMRGDFAARWLANVSAVNAGILTPNEVRAQEGWNGRPDGDVLRTMPGAAPVVPGTADPPAPPIPADAGA